MSNVGSSKQTTSEFSQIRPPGYIEQPLAGAASAAQLQAFGGAPESYVTRQSRDLAGQTLRGDFLTTGTNPYLQGVANNIGDNVFNQTAQRFAGAGRNVGGTDAAGVFRRDLTNQLSPMFAQNFENERQRQMQTMGQSSQFDPINQFIERLGLLAPSAGREITSSGTTRDRASPLDTFLGLFG